MTAPELSVVVPSVNGWDDLLPCLTALDAERRSVRLQVLLPERCGESVRALVAGQFPDVEVLPVQADTPIPAMRAMAFDRAQARSVAVIEDHVIVPPGWAHDLLLARESADVVGGAVQNLATEHLVDRAAFLCEYSQLMPPLPAGTSDSLAGNNVVYDRALLERHREATHAGRWEDHLHRALQADGVRLICRPEIVVGHRKHYSIGEYLAQRYLYARSYAGARVEAEGPLRRGFFGAGAFALPPILFWRIVSRSLRKVPDRLAVWSAMPLLALFVSAWTAGEIVGYWFGPGDSLSRIR